ncbi:biosynthesis cluster domain-containing protein [Streptomyces hygroscopicus subsp. hygroscopicus]|uniref:Biosynthetic protein (TIGR04098 family) n=1 Tax=Streptomyces demainii TaxID=588122 RepID=A0ABT9L908_9ACTN|nr:MULTISPECIES: LnmK family bifunctional acyltransferase/decarboxylase [Streptomyces]MBW8093743.1 biosynthesis cluster domain-containing protein [Streptomyces hygroscopicus subsp. hygroscopicus]MDP9616237.1 putative biosynthetic protein (TIGR04098 family) [Streptomyces demainii]
MSEPAHRTVPGQRLHRPDASSLRREVLVSPGMCGAGSLVFGQIGDWTWEAVAAACGTNVHAARTADGRPAYLSFYYYRVRGGRTLHPHGLTFGDELRVDSRVFQYGGQSAVTLHRLAPAGLDLPDGPLDPAEVYERPHPDCLYAENFNRWIARSRPGSNESLARTAPPGFAHRHLPRLPNAHSPRSPVGRAREAGTFHPVPPPGFAPSGPGFSCGYELDTVRDLNGAGLVYFAAYFAIFDTALLRSWRSLGRPDEQFLRRRVVDERIGFFGNADPGTVLRIEVRRWRGTGSERPGAEIADMALRDAASGRLLAVASIETGPDGDAAAEGGR